MGRPRKAKGELVSLAECNVAMGRLLTAQVAREVRIAARDGQIAEAMQEHERAIEELTEEAKDFELQLQNFYMAHVEELEKDGRKSVGLANGVMGRRKGPAALKLLNRAWTWAAVLAKLQSAFKDKFVRFFYPEVDKEKVKSDLAEEEMAKFGLKLHQEDKFYVEPFRPAGD